ncbi:TonB-dependent receptor [Novosphingobium sp. PS1R-30]|uniref:TonB-dependent receptor n=1 Tax=Novosphingobium anseongense TaxID=3133436 RepID=A0ABU8S2X5_9SPHN
MHTLTRLALGCSTFGLAMAMSPQAVLAQDGAAGETDAGAIIVTARRVEERLQDVPISITVFNQQQLTNRNVTSGVDLAIYTPSLQANSRYGVENTSFAIRGFTQEQRTTASVAVYFADVVAPRGGGATTTGDGAGPGSFFDLQNVQVLKGPQGTLFGRNTTGGALLLVPQKPTANLEGYVEGSAGNHDLRRVQGVINIPLGETARLRAGVDRQVREGYLRNISGIGPDEFNNIDYVAARASLSVDLTPDLETYFIASYMRSDTNGPLPKLTSCFPVVRGAQNITGVLSCDQIARASGQDYFSVDNGLANAKLFMEQWQVINTTTWQAGDTLTIKNIASYAQLTNRTRNEAFGTRWVIPATFNGLSTGANAGLSATFVNIQHVPGLNTSDQSTFSEELQFQGRSADDALIWQAGAYLELSDPLGLQGNLNPSTLSCVGGSYDCTDVVGALRGRPGTGGSLGYQVGRTAYRNIGVYGQASYKLTPQLQVTGGIRYTWDRMRSTNQKAIYTFAVPNVAVGQCTNSLLRNRAFTDPRVCEEAFEKSTKAPTWLIGLDFHPVGDVLLYAKYSRGYRQGGTNPFSAEGYNTYDAERVDTYEVGAKTSWRGAVPGSFNVAGFYNDFRDQQVQTGFTNSRGLIAPNTAIVNAGKSRIQGIEVEATLTPFAGLSLNGSYAYLDTKLLEFAPVPLPSTLIPGSLFDTPIPTNAVGQPLTFAPKHKLSVTGMYTLPLPESFGSLTIGATYSYTSALRATYSGTQGLLPPTDLLNLNLNWNGVAGSPIDVSVFATNVTNERYFTQVNEQSSSGFVSKFLGEPRMYGVRVRYRFGS